MAHERAKFTSRTKARKRAAEVLFEADQKGLVRSPGGLLALLDERKTTTVAPSPLPVYAVRMVEGVAANLPEIDSLLSRHTTGIPLDRLPAFDLSVMRGAVWEMLGNQDEVPPIVAIDEAVAVVKLISTDDSPSRVNAILDAIRKEVGEIRGRSSSVEEPPTEATPEEPTEEPTEDLEPEAPLDADFDDLDLLDEY